MGKQKADLNTIQLIYKLAQKPEKVRSTNRAEWEMFSLNLTRKDICDAICNWIESGKTVVKDFTRRDPKNVGEPFYIMKPVVLRQGIYLKVGIYLDSKSGEYMLIISAHELH